MEAALQNLNEEWPECREKASPYRMDAKFTEIYELIFYNNTMVETELNALQQLIEKKYQEKTGASSLNAGGDTRSAYLRQASAV
jgi:hypothetical protein